MTNADKLTDKALELINQMQHAVPHVADLSLTSIRVNAIIILLVGIIGTAIMFVGFRIISKSPKTVEWDDDVGVCLFLVGLLISVFVYLNIWNWIAIFNPALYVAHEVTNKIIGG